MVWLVLLPARAAVTPPNEGLEAEMAGEWRKAISIYEQVLDKTPQRSDLWRRIAQIRIRLKDISGAISALRKAVELNPRDAASHFDLATLLSMEKKPEEALIHAEKAKRIEPRNIEYLRTHARLANWLKRFQEAAESYQRIHLLRPDDEAALKDLGDTLSWAGRHREAAELYQDYLRRRPDQVALWIALSRERARMDDQEGAIAALKKAYELKPNDAQISAELSRMYAMQNEPEKALVHVRRALRIQPDNLEYLRAHAQIANWAKRPAEAAASLERILARKPDDRQVFQSLARTYQWAGEPEKATLLYERWLQREPDELRLWLLVAEGKMKQNKPHEAITLLERAYAKFVSRSSSAAVSRLRNLRPERLPVLLYHCIGERADNDYWISADEFAAQMAELKRKGYQSVTSHDVEGYLFGSNALPPKPVMITFDDACRNLYTHAWPILKKNGFKADIFIFTDAIRNEAGQRASVVQHRHGKETLLEYMIWPEIREMVADGFAIGAHSKSHADMKKLDEPQLKYEILYSKLQILAETGVAVTAFSYPFGSGFHRKEIHEELREAGFHIAFAAHGGVADLERSNPMEIPRIEIWGPRPNSDPGSLGVSVVPDPERPYDLFRHRIEPNEAEAHYELSRLYTMADDAPRALEEIEKALASDPYNRRYLRDMTQLANWNDRHDLALEGYGKLAALGEEDDELLLNRARISSYIGELDDSARYYERYLRLHPDNRAAAMERIRVESWRGNSGRAMALLEAYRARFGEDEGWFKTKVDILSWGERPRETERILRPLLQQKPGDYQLNFAKVLAAHFGGRPRDALRGLQELEEHDPDADDNRLLRRVVTAPYRPLVSLESAYVTSSENLEALTTTLQAVYSPIPEMRLGLKLVQEWFSARVGSGLEAIDGSSGAQYQNIQAGVRYRFSPLLLGDIHLGRATAEGEGIPISTLGLDVSPADGMNLRLQYSRDYFHEYYSSSPKTISLNIEEEATRLYVDWRPDFNYRISAQLGYSCFSDENCSRRYQLSVRRAVLRTQRWNLDLGLSSGVLDFSDKKGNGYYEPDYYQRYMFASNVYWKAGEQGGVSVSLGLGVAKDELMEGFKLASEGDISGEFRLEDGWWFHFGINGVHNVTRGGDAYTGSGVNLSVSRRF